MNYQRWKTKRDAWWHGNQVSNHPPHLPQGAHLQVMWLPWHCGPIYWQLLGLRKISLSTLHATIKEILRCFKNFGWAWQLLVWFGSTRTLDVLDSFTTRAIQADVRDFVLCWFTAFMWDERQLLESAWVWDTESRSFRWLDSSLVFMHMNYEATIDQPIHMDRLDSIILTNPQPLRLWKRVNQQRFGLGIPMVKQIRIVWPLDGWSRSSIFVTF